MVRHILRKDLTLLWPIVAGFSALCGLVGLSRFAAGRFLQGFPGTPLSFLVLLAAATVMTLAVHQDPIPGVRQDWLVRPIRRRDVFLAKLVFAIVFVQGPWFAIDTVQGVANAFPFAESAGAAAACGVWILLTVTLPVVAFAALTSTTTEMLVGGVCIFAVVVGFLVVPGFAGLTRPAALTGFAWIPALVREAVLLAAAAAVLLLQYRSRRTAAARALFAAALIAGLSSSFLPWRATWQLDQLLNATSSDAAEVVVAFAADAGRFHAAPGQGIDDVAEKPGMGAADVADENQRRRAEGARTVFVPVRVSGLRAESRLLADRTDVALIGRDGRVVYRGTGNDFEVHGSVATAAIHQGVRVPGAIFSRLKNEPVDLQLDYSFTVFQARATYALPASDGDQRMPGVGWCATRVNEQGSRVMFACMQPGERPPCLALTLEDPRTEQRNPDVSLCAPDYSPYPGHVFGDALSRFGGSLPFFDPSGLVRYPVGGPQLGNARVIVTDFRPAGHFVRHITIHSVRMKDWEPQPLVQ